MKYQKRQVKTAPGDYTLTLLTLARAREYLLATSGVTDQDNVITDLIHGAIQHIEAGLDYPIDTNSLIYQYYDHFPDDGILPIWHRYITTTSLVVEYWRGATWSAVDSSNYRIDISSAPPRVFLTSTGEWPDDVSDDMNSVRVGFKMDTAHNFLDDIKVAAMSLIAAKYENREEGTIPASVDRVINRHKLR